MRRIGVLMGYPEAQSEFASFVQELQKLGWAEGRNLRTDIRWGIPADPESMHRFAKELVALQPDLILSQSTPTTAALLQETRAIPIIFAIVADPIGSGFVASLARPGGNATGFVVTQGSLGSKWLQLLKEIAPRVTRIAALFNPAMAPYAEYLLSPFEAAAPSLQWSRSAHLSRTRPNLNPPLLRRLAEPNSGLFVLPDAFTFAYRVEIVSLAVRYRLPAVYAFRFFLNSTAYCPMEVT
jgi:ABC transporter substrate binding protein